MYNTTGVCRVVDLVSVVQPSIVVIKVVVVVWGGVRWELVRFNWQDGSVGQVGLQEVPLCRQRGGR